MGIVYKVDVMELLKENGYSTYKLRKEKIFGENIIQMFRSGKVAGIKTLETICELTKMQPGDIIKYIE